MIGPDEAGLALKTGQLCLDFANTAEWHARPESEEHLRHYTDLVAWAHGVGLLSEREAQRLKQEARARPADAAAALARAVRFREAIYRIFSAIAHGRRPSGEDLATLNTALPAALARLRLVSHGDRVTWQWAGIDRTLDVMLWPVLRSAAEVLTSPEVGRVGECADDRGCGWLFWDTSKNRSRRWCDMRDCGNRAKAHRHYMRQREHAETGDEPA